jgi:hypothetical protein
VVDAFEFWGPDGTNERPTAAADMVSFVEALASYARAQKPGFLIVPQNGSQLVLDAGYVAAVDGIGAEDTWTVGDRVQQAYQPDHVTGWLDLFRDAGKVVLTIDYPRNVTKVDDFYSRSEARGYVPVNPPRALDRYVLNPHHPPSSVPSVVLDTPLDTTEVSSTVPPTFHWTGAGGAASYLIVFSGDDSFRRLLKMPSTKGFITASSFTPSNAQWKKIAKLAERNGLGNIYWWVEARNAAGGLGSSRARRLVRLHEAVSTTIFWIGEPASPDNGFIANDDSAWDECWKERYGGIDDPDQRSGYLPAGFTPNENPFYAALPYNDLDANGDRKANVGELVPWARNVVVPPSDSAVKNHWLKIVHGGATCYAQWEDVGPFGENDAAYVFGSKRPRSAANQHAGLDVSPALRDCLGLTDGITPTSWRFVDASDVPAGPWKLQVTSSGLNFDPPSCP